MGYNVTIMIRLMMLKLSQIWSLGALEVAFILEALSCDDRKLSLMTLLLILLFSSEFLLYFEVNVSF